MTEHLKKIVIAVLVLLIVAVSFVYYNNYQNNLRAKAILIKTSEEDAIPDDLESADNNINSEGQNTIKVHVAGAVNSPGLYEAPSGSRIDDLIKLAGGSAADAYLDGINLADFAADGQQVYVPRISAQGEIEAFNAGAVKPEASKLVNINTASLSQLMTLNGVGESIGGAIIKYREANGGFKNIEDIKNVSGIGEKRFEQIKDNITVK